MLELLNGRPQFAHSHAAHSLSAQLGQMHMLCLHPKYAGIRRGTPKRGKSELFASQYAGRVTREFRHFQKKEQMDAQHTLMANLFITVWNF